MRGRYVIANWKMNLPPEGMAAYLAAVAGVDSIIVAPPFPYLKDVGGKVRVAAQNCSDQRSGAFTGEISPLMLQDCNVDTVILGHSERRNLFGETDALIARKLALAIDVGLMPVLCIGEDLSIRDSGQAAMFLANQIRAAVTPQLEYAKEIVIAYEPVWAIGTGRNASGTMCAEMIVEIREALARFWPSRFADSAPILYGGSVTPDNVADLVENGGIDGFLVGGASLDSAKFLAIRAALDSPAQSGKNSHP